MQFDSPERNELKAEADRLLQQGTEQYQSMQLEDAIASWQQAQTIYRELQDPYNEGATFNNIGLAYIGLGNNNEGIKAYEQSLAIARSTNNRQMEVNALANLGRAADALHDYTQALEFYQEALPIARELKNRLGEGSIATGIALAYQLLGNYQKASEFYLLMLAVARELNDPVTEATALAHLGIVHQALSDYPKAAQFLEERLALSQILNNKDSDRVILGILGNVYHSMGNYPKAIERMQQSLALAEELNQPRVMGEVLNNIGNIYADLGEYQQAIAFYEKGLQVARKSSNTVSEKELLLNLGTLYQTSLGDFPKALEYYQQCPAIPFSNDSLDAYQVEADGKLLCEIYQRMAIIYQLQGDYSQAVDLYRQSLTITREINYTAGETAILNNWATLYVANLGDYQQALALYEQSLEISRNTGNFQLEGKALGNLAYIYDALGDSTRAIEYQRQRLDIAQQTADRQGEGTALNNLGAMLLKTGKAEEAEAVLLSSIEVWESLRISLGNNDAAKISIFDEQARTYRLLQKTLIAQKKTDEALEIAERGRARALVDLLASRRYSESVTAAIQTFLTSPTAQEIKRIAQSHKAYLIEYSFIYETLELEGQPIQPRESQIFTWVVNPAGEISFRSVDLKPLQAQQTSLSDLILRVRRFLTMGEQNRDVTPLISAEPSLPNEAVFELLQQLYQYLIHPIAELLPTDSNTPIIFIPQGSLYLVPFGALQDSVTEEYLSDRYIIQTAPSIQVLDLLRPQEDSRKQGKGDALVVGNPIMPFIGQPPKRLAQLLASEFAAKAIAKLWNSEVIIGANATKETILEQLPQARLIHLGTHALLNEQQPLQSAIALAPGGDDNGFLSAEEILKHYGIAQELSLQAELVVLSACSTGLGKITGDGVVGFSRCLMAAGIKRLVVSLWAVPDLATAFLMVRFYKNLQGDSSPAKALKEAQQWLRNLTTRELWQWIQQERLSLESMYKQELKIWLKQEEAKGNALPFQYPYYWAAFCLIGQ